MTTASRPPLAKHARTLLVIVAEAALDALEMYLTMETHDEAHILEVDIAPKAIELLRARLAQREREWQGLTDEEITETLKRFGLGERAALARAIEAKLKEKNA